MSTRKRRIGGGVAVVAAVLAMTAAPALADMPAGEPVAAFSAAEAQARPAAYGADAYEGRVVTTTDTPVKITGVQVWEAPLTAAVIAAQAITLGVPTVAGATAALEPDGTILYTPAPGHVGWDEIRIQSSGMYSGASIRIIVNAPNGMTNTVKNASAQAKVAVVQVHGSISIVTGIPGNVLTAGISYITVSNPAHPGATAFAEDDGTISYFAPDEAGWTGDAFTYTVWDNDGNAATATITITMAATPSEIKEDKFSGVQGSPVTIDVLANDNLPFGIAHLKFTNTSGGGHELPDGTWVETPALSVVTNADNTITVTAPADYIGPAAFAYGVTDSSGTAYKTFYGSEYTTVTVTFEPADGPALPVARDDNGEHGLGVFVAASRTTVIDVLANDDIPAGLGRLLIYEGQHDGWTFEVTADNKLAVTAPASWDGNMPLQYVIEDVRGYRSAPAVVNLFIHADIAYPADLHVFTWADVPVALDPTHANDLVLDFYNVDPAVITPILPEVAMPGTVSRQDGAAWVFDPADGFTGDVEVSFDTGGPGNVQDVRMTVHVLGPISQNWAVGFPAGDSGRVENVLDGALWGTHEDLVKVATLWRIGDLPGWALWDPAEVRSFDGSAVMAPEASLNWAPQVAVLPEDHGRWPGKALTAQILDPLHESTFKGKVTMVGDRAITFSADVPQTTQQTYAAVTAGGVAGPVAYVDVEVWPTEKPTDPPTEPEVPEKPTDPPFVSQ